jgi:nicotinate-nucleotide adenylyltransferase
MRVALFGGSFDPPHVGHQLACLYVLLTYPVDQVWMIPVYRHAFDKRCAPFAQRVALCELAAAAVGPRVRVCTIEEELSGQSYTLRTVQALRERHPEHEFALVVGADLSKERERWYGWPELAKLVPFLVLGRGGVSGSGGPVPPARDHVHADGIELPAVCSTDVRARLQGGELPEGLVDRRVLAYIVEHGLYGARPPAAAADDLQRSGS